ncbi:beta strand repeat-containing protein [Rubrivirga sp. IMCC45206]|uniref:beta strand repeat-containing protein n=1 Tax=Rubrivirga sp. IMCC45206 TaxID=3391614 RepID=UPI00398FDFED
MPLASLFRTLRALALGATVLGAGAASAATITVNTLDDERNADGDCSLREAVEAADTDAAVDACTAGSGSDTIVFDPVLALGTIVLGQEAITVDEDLTIDGDDGVGRITLSGSDLYRVFIVDSASLTLTNLNLTNGRAPSGGAVLVREGGSLTTDMVTFADNEATGNDATQGGGAVYLQGGSATFRDTDFSDNVASGTSGSGGAFAMIGAGNTASAVRTTFSGNTANRAGGAIENRDGTLDLIRADFDGNDAGANPGNGGAIHLSAAGAMTADRGTVSNNTAVEGGGFWNSGSTMRIEGTVFTNNTATGDAADNGGGALYNEGGQLTVVDVTATDNEATGTSGSGGAILNNGGRLVVMSSTISDNTANRAGGGIEDAGGTAVLIMAEMTGNDAGTAPGNGGAVHTGGGVVVVAGGTFANNTAVEGGGLWTSGSLIVTSDEANIPDGMTPPMTMPTITEARITGNTATGDDADQGGGGLYATAAGSILMFDGRVSNNVASGASGSGGGLFSAGALTLNGTLVSNNTANRAGGGIEDAGGTVVLTDVRLTRNTIDVAAPGNGGGLHSGGGDVTITRSTVNENTAVEGGGLWSNGTLTINGGADGDDPEDDDAEDGDRTAFTTIVDNTATGGDAGTGGGGIYVETGGDASVRYARIARNAATGASGSGGGLLVADGAVASLAFSEITENTANRAGAGIELFDDVLTTDADDVATVTLRQVTVADNAIDTAAPGNGGGLHAGGGSVVRVEQSTFSGNTATEGGGLWINVSARLTLDNSTVSGNTSDEDGGGVYDHNGGSLALSSVTVVNNTAGGDGGGLLSASTAKFTLDNVLLGDNTAGGTGADCDGTFVSTGNNLIESLNDCTVTGETASNISGVNPGVAALADNGGFTQTHALLPSSAALNAGDSAFEVDQRNRQRRFSADDIGAFEAGASPVAIGDGPEAGAFALAAPAPNPTTSRTTLSFSVATAERVEVAVFNVLGQRVLTVFDGLAAASDVQTVPVDVSGLASGVYVVRLAGAQGVATRQLTVVR